MPQLLFLYAPQFYAIVIIIIITGVVVVTIVIGPCLSMCKGPKKFVIFSMGKYFGQSKGGLSNCQKLGILK